MTKGGGSQYSVLELLMSRWLEYIDLKAELFEWMFPENTEVEEL
jgi:hypothetical protein